MKLSPLTMNGRRGFFRFKAFAMAVGLAVPGILTAKAGTTNVIGSVTLASGSPITIAAGNVTQSAGTIAMDANSSASFAAITGAGTLQFVSTTNNATTYPDLYFDANDATNSHANDGVSISTTVDLNGGQRYIWGNCNHNGVGQYGLTAADCMFNGSIIGSGGLTFFAQMTYNYNTPLMEVPFCLNAANSFTGPVIIERGSVYLGANNAFPAGDVLQFAVPAGDNGRFFLYGHSTTISNLSSTTSAGTPMIANGNANPSGIGPATLTILQTTSATYSGSILDTNSEYGALSGSSVASLSLVKNGPGTLTLSGTNKFSGSLTVNGGELYFNAVRGAFVGLVMVTNGATLGGSGLIATNVTVGNGSSLEAGGGTGSGTLTMKSLVLGAVASDALSLNLSSTVAGLATSFAVTNVNGFTNNGTTTINISGTLPTTTPAIYTLLTYSNAINGSGTFVLGNVPALIVTPYLTNNATLRALQLVVPAYVAPAVTWVGTPTNDWDLAGNQDWVQTGTTTPASYADGDGVVFDDTAVNFNVNLAATVEPYTVLFTNSINNYTVSGLGSIASTVSLTKQGLANVVLNGANLSVQSVAVDAGTLYLNANTAAGGVVAVAGGGTLGGSGSIISPVIVANGGALVAGSDLGSGTLTMNSLSLGVNATDALALNLASSPAGLTTTFAVIGTSTLTNNGITTFNVTGTLPAGNPAVYNLLAYAGTVKGNGAFVLGTVANAFVNAYVTNNASADAIQLVIPLQPLPSLTWFGSPTNDWDLAGDLDWVQTGTATPASFVNGSPVVFDDTAANFNVNLAATVLPYSVVFSNNVNNYSVTGAGGISNTASLTKLGTASVILGVANEYSGNTMVGAGTLALGANGAIPSGPTAGNVTVNGTLDLASYSPVVNNLNGTGVVDDVTAGGSSLLTISNTVASTFAGAIQNTTGTVGVTKTGAGTLTLAGNNSYAGGTTLAAGTLAVVNGTGLGTGPLTVTENLAGETGSFLTVATNGAVTLTNNINLPGASGTYVLTKNSTGHLTLAGTIGGGVTGTVLRTTTDTTGDGTTVTEFAGTNSFAGGLQTYRGVVQVDNPSSLGTATIYGDGNNSTNGDLSFANSMIFGNALVLQSPTTLSSSSNNVVMTGPISGSYNITKYGSGNLTLAGANTYSGVLAADAGTLTIGSVTLAADLTGPAPAINTISIAAGATVQSSGTLTMDASSSLNPSICVTGAGTLVLTATNNNASSPDINFNSSDLAGSTANWGTRIATPLNLGSVQRYIWGQTDHSGVGEYGVTEADCQFEGTISGSGGLTFVAQDSFASTTQPMETPFCLNAVNTFTGPVQIQRGSVYLGVAGAYPAGDVLQFNVAAGNLGKFFLYGQSATIADLSSTGTGTAFIADGNTKPSSVGPATLTIIQNNPETFYGSLVDTNLEYPGSATSSSTVLSVVKSGPAALTLAGNNSFSGSLAVYAGKLYINGASTGGGAVTVSNGATLGGMGAIAAAVTVSNGAALEAGGGAGLGTLSLNSLTLGTQAADMVTLNFDAIPSGVDSVSVTKASGFANNATVTVNVTGVLPASAPVVYTLVSYAGTIQGAGTFVLGSVPDSAVAYLTNNTAASALQLVVSSVTIPSVTWFGSPTNDWDLLGNLDWVVTGVGTPAAYADFDSVVFDDTATNFLVNLAANVSPDGVLFTNNVSNYVLMGNGGIAGYTSLTVAGNGTVTFLTTNSYSGQTTIGSGTLSLGTAGALPGGPGAGNVIVNGTLDLAGNSPVANNLSGTGVVDDLVAGGSPVLTVSNSTASIFSGVMQNTSGTLELNKAGGGILTLSGNNNYSGVTVVNNGVLQIGNGGTAGTLGAGSVLDMTTLAFDRSDTNTIPNSIAGSGGIEQNGTGTVTLRGNLTYTGPTAANAGTLLFPEDVTFDAGTGAALMVASNAVVETGFEIFLNANASANALDMAGAGTVRLVSAIDRAESYADMVIGNNNNGVSTANYGIRIASGLDLGTTNRLFWAISSRDDVTTYGLGGCDCQFAGPLYGSALLTLLGKNSWTGVNTMEEQFAFTGTNFWTGTLEVQRGSVYVGNTNAFTGANILILDPQASVNSRLFLYGNNAAFANLQSGAYGSVLIANGNNVTSSNVGPATLTINENQPTTFAGDIMDWYTEYTAPHTGPLSPALGLVKNGPAALVLSGADTYSGPTVVNAGKLYINNTSTGGGAVTVNTNATLGGSGVINSLVTVNNGGTIEGGSGAGNGALQIKGLTLGAASDDSAVLNLTPAAILNVTNNNGLVLNGGAGSVTVNIGGTVQTVGDYPLITYAGTPGGTGFTAFQLGTLPTGVFGYLSNDVANASIDFVATLVTVPRWSGAYSSDWSTTVEPAPKNWVLDADGVTPVDYLDGENVKFDDGSTNPVVNISVASVSPASVTISNVVQNYTIVGTYGITGAGSLYKLGSGSATLGSVNNYSGNTIISAGTLALGVAGAIPGGAGAGNVTVNGTLDVAGHSPTLNNLSGGGTLDDLTAGGSAVVTANETISTLFSGVIQNTTGSLGLMIEGGGTLTLSSTNTYFGPTVVNGGTLLVNGALGATPVSVAAGAALGGTGMVKGAATLYTGSALDLTANTPLTLGALTLVGTVTVDVSGPVSVTNTATYVLANYRGINTTNMFALAPVAGLFNSGMTATLDATTNQLLLTIAPTKPTGTIADVKHIVIFMQENRSFDHYYGSLHGVHGYSDHVTLTLPNGNSDLYQPSGSGYELPFHSTIECLSDLDHSWPATHEAWDSGKEDQWVAAKGTETMAFYNRSDLAYYYSLADNFTICDEYHCSVMSSTDPNRVSFWTGMIDPTDLGGGPLIDNTEPSAGWGTGWVTYPELLQKAGVTWKVYQASDNYDDNALFWFAAYKDAPAGSPLNVNGTLFAPSIESGTGFPADYTNLMAEFKGAVTSNTLPAVSWIIGPDVGSEHPSWSPGDGEIITKGLLDALASNPAVYNSTVFILNYDENDGFFDHAVPINPPAGTTNEFVSGLPIGLGVRVPCTIISPWTTGGHVDSQVFDHTSILRFLEKWTGVYEPNISAWRRQVCGDLTSAFDFAHPNTNYPSLLLSTENDCDSGSTATPPGSQTVPAQESGTLIARPLPYQPNAVAALNCGSGNVSIQMTNSGAASVHFSVYANAYSTVLPTPFDVNPSNSLTGTFAAATSGNYDYSCYGPNGFLRRFAGNLGADCGQIESLAYLNPYANAFEITLANPSGAAVVFSVANGWFTNSLSTYTVPAGSTNLVFLDASTNHGWYDLAVTASTDSLFARRFAGHIETNAIPAGLLSSENPSGFKDNVTFTATFVGFGTPTGTAQFLTNGVAMGAPVPLVNGVASAATALLPRTNNSVSVVYSGDELNTSVTNCLTQTVLDHPPVTATVVYQRAADLPLNILVSDLLTNVTDVDGDPITLVGVGADGFNLMTTNGVALSTNANYITYTNSVTPSVNDSFEYTVSDGYGGVSMGTVLIVVNTNYVVPPSVPLILYTTNAVVNFFGTPGSQYEVDRSTNLTPGVGTGWVPISTNVAPYSGIIQVNDAFIDLGLQPATPGAAFYRLRPNP